MEVHVEEQVHPPPLGQTTLMSKQREVVFTSFLEPLIPLIGSILVWCQGQAFSVVLGLGMFVFHRDCLLFPIRSKFLAPVSSLPPSICKSFLCGIFLAKVSQPSMFNI